MWNDTGFSRRILANIASRSRAVSGHELCFAEVDVIRRYVEVGKHHAHARQSYRQRPLRSRSVPRRGAWVAAAIGAFGAAAAAYLAVKRAGTRTQRDVGRCDRDDRAVRSVEMATLGAKTGGTYALHRARRVFASAERRDELDAEHQLRTAEQVADALGHMKGALMKLGQMASYLDQGLPEPIREQLAQLAGRCAVDEHRNWPRRWSREELGQPPERLFATWDPVPMAAASIGQVHRAITKDGLAVAVKVQYPGVDEAIEADLDNAGLLLQVIAMVFPGLEPEPIVEELRVRVREELDYVQEADNQQLFARYYDHIPSSTSHPSSSAVVQRVLTTELADGARFDELLTWSQDEQEPRRRGDLPVRVRQPVAAPARSTAIRTRATTCSTRAGTSRSSTSGS